ncbi:homoserine kinase [Novosphingobium sp. FSY-8]|uniref:Homoserine kinase n=1 Tax=Novosphingobium ovatum TaxID=1908523 RepID=A0ABW9XE39_9SPHN|nr:homoserine kinase [Novosphingobium ovatum]NBC36805.1 homoserine kinase [Novosphingobium ovatum]
MAVYTQLTFEDARALIGQYDVGQLTTIKGIAEGVSNSNWIVHTTGGAFLDAGGAPATRFILTMFEGRTEVAELPFFLGLLDHLAAQGCPVPRTVHDRDGAMFRNVQGKAATLIEFLDGASISTPTAPQARAVGAALARVHVSGATFPAARRNTLGLAGWRELTDACGPDALHDIHPELAGLITREMAVIERRWPADLPTGIVHADLFPDNVLMKDDAVAGLIDFYFACNDILAYDVAVTHAAWCFSSDGRRFDAGVSAALLAGYESVRPLTEGERAALPVLARGAAMRFLSTRAYDWINTPPDAMVTKKDPMAFARRLEFYANPGNAAIFAAA